jgi:hypothetical protein
MSYGMDDPIREYLLYDIRRGHLAIAFSMEIDVLPIIGKATPDKVQIYYSYAEPSRDTIASEFYQYYWYTIEVSVQSDMPRSTIDCTWRDQTSTSKDIETASAKYHAIMECVGDQRHWCSEDYLLETNSASEGISLQEERRMIQQYLIDDLFLLSTPGWIMNMGNFILVHSLSQQHALWSRNKLFFYVLISEEKAIFTYDKDGTARY